jgi:hypothetical protein
MWCGVVSCHVVRSFDFSGADKPPRKTLPMSDERCLNVLINLGVLSKGAWLPYVIHYVMLCYR